MTAQAQVKEVPAWQLVWSDEFEQPDGAAPNLSSWTYDLGGNGWGNQELQTYTARRENSYIADGHLVIEAREERHRGTDGITRDYTSARLKTQGRRTWTYGRVEARMQLTEGQGIWPAFWMLGANFPAVGWPDCGEIDIMEQLGHERNTVYGGLHGPDYSGGDNVGGEISLRAGPPLSWSFHLYAVEWEPERIRWSVDNNVFLEVTPDDLPRPADWVFDHSFFIIMNVAVGGLWPGAPDDSTSFPQRLQVDYVRVYRRLAQPPPVLSITERQGAVETSWPQSFPHARLQRADDIEGPWLEVPTDGAQRERQFVSEVGPGVYRLVWDP
jgi:beta-glucanase (GH16 family)